MRARAGWRGWTGAVFGRNVGPGRREPRGIRRSGRIEIAIASTASPRAAPPPGRRDSLRGIALMAAGMFLFSGVDTMAKLLTETLHPVQIVWCRQIGLLLGVLVLIGVRGRGVLRSSRPWLQTGRGVLAACSATLFIAGVGYVPLADAVAITFVAPFLVTVMGAAILGETVGLRRWVAVAVGFLGALIVIRPGMGVVHPAAGLILLAAAAFALRQVLSRILAGGDGAGTTVAYTALASCAVLTIPLPFYWQTPVSGAVIGLLAAMAVVAAAAETLVIMALDAAEAVVIAPVHYTLIVWGTVYGFAVFGQLPDGWTLLGAAVIVASGLYTLDRDRRAARGLSRSRGA